MHQQVKTSPDDFGGPDEGLTARQRLKVRLEALNGINIEGVAPELESAHLRWAFRDAALPAALTALARWQPEVRHAFTAKLGNVPGGLDGLLDVVEGHGYDVESVLVLATDVGDGILVQVGVDREVSQADWDDMGGWDDEGSSPAS